jgi:indolepyruvate decarboxylase
METKRIGDYLIERLYEYGVRHVFGVPGDYVLGFFNQISKSKMNLINACDEQGAGFMADAYARMRGLGVVCVTYGVGGFKVINTTAQAYSEKSPVVIISGAPGREEIRKFPFLHHQVRDADTQKKVFEQITAASIVLDNPQTAKSAIDRVLSFAVQSSLPVYIELPRDMHSVPIVDRQSSVENPERTDASALQEAVKESVDMINSAKKPVIITGVEIQRFDLQDKLRQLIKKTNMPVAETILGKSIIDESNPLYLGIYEGELGEKYVRRYVDSSDCLILLGTLKTDINLEIFGRQIYQGQAIYHTGEKLSISHHIYENVHIQDFLKALLYSKIKPKKIPHIPHHKQIKKFVPVKDKKISAQRLFQCINSFLTSKTNLVVDVGDSLFGSVDLALPKGTVFLCSTFYASLGFSVPASIGAQMANPNLRPLVLVGDGAFQMTGIELSTAVRYKLNPIVIVLNNKGYSTERVILDGPFNDVQMWNFSKIPDLFGGGKGFVVETEDQLSESLSQAKKHTDGFCILDVHLEPTDISPTLQRLAKHFAGKVL